MKTHDIRFALFVMTTHTVRHELALASFRVGQLQVVDADDCVI